MSAADHRAWFRKADANLLSIRNNLAANEVPWDVLTYDAQQAAEKSLKGFLVYRGAIPPKIHDLARLLDLCTHHDESLEALREDCIELTDAGFRSRYPGMPDEPAEEDARDAVTRSRRICDAVRHACRSKNNGGDVKEIG
jgi:HEPN domain-containing protein